MRLVVHGVEIWRHGAPTAQAAAVRVLSVDQGRILLEVPPGSWTIEAVGAGAGARVLDEVFNLSENPIRSDRVHLNFSQRAAVAAVFTLDGRLVVDLTRRQIQSDGVTWDLTNEQGARVAPGVYLLVAQVGAVVVRRRLVVVHGR